MKSTQILVPMLALAFAAGSVSSFAAPAKDGAAKGEKKERRMNKDAKPRKVTMTPRMREMMESATGKPLTDEQSAQVLAEETAFRAAQKELRDQHHAKIAQILGITVEQLDTAEKAARKNGATKATPAVPATPGVSPATPAVPATPATDAPPAAVQ